MSVDLSVAIQNRVRDVNIFSFEGDRALGDDIVDTGLPRLPRWLAVPLTRVDKNGVRGRKSKIENFSAAKLGNPDLAPAGTVARRFPGPLEVEILFALF
jgi:hypothetical protein